MITIPRSFRIDEDEQQKDWSAKINEFVRDTIGVAARVQQQSTIVEIPFVGGSADVAIATAFKFPVRGVWVVYVEDTDADAVITSAVWAHWRFERGSVVLRNVSGLTSGTNYRLRLQIFGN